MIDPRAIVDPRARLADDVEVGPYAIIGPQVEIGAGSVVGPHAVVTGRTRIGVGNRIYQFAAIGEIPQDLKYAGEDTLLEIGDRNIFREFCSVHTGTVQGGGVTRIGSDNLIMNYVHVAHDCIIGDHCILANYVGLAGHVRIDDYVVLSGFAKVVQFARLGAYSFVVANSDVGKDVLPYVIVGGTAAAIKPYGLNLVGLRRHGFDEDTVVKLKEAYNIILRRHLDVKTALTQLNELVQQCSAVQAFIDALENMGERGIIR